jgi:hypothetical protein
VARSIGALGACVVLSALSQAQLSYFSATINGVQETPSTGSPAVGVGCFTLDSSINQISWNVTFSGLLGTQTAAHIHQGAIGVSGGIIVGIPNGSPSTGTAALTPAQVAALQAGLFYVNIHTTVFPNGEIRGQILPVPAPVPFCFGDGTSGACPCANQSTVGNNEGCLHSPGVVGGKLIASGGSSIQCDSLQLCASQLLGTNCLFVQGSTAPAGPFAFGDGLRCIGGQLKRIAISPISGGNACLGGLGTTTQIHTIGAVVPGTYGYQVWYRDNTNYCTAFAYNMTNGVLVTWVP